MAIVTGHKEEVSGKGSDFLVGKEQKGEGIREVY